jgi:hypothetical protein
MRLVWFVDVKYSGSSTCAFCAPGTLLLSPRSMITNAKYLLTRSRCWLFEGRVAAQTGRKFCDLCLAGTYPNVAGSS